MGKEVGVVKGLPLIGDRFIFWLPGEGGWSGTFLTWGATKPQRSGGETRNASSRKKRICEGWFCAVITEKGAGVESSRFFLETKTNPTDMGKKRKIALTLSL